MNEKKLFSRGKGIERESKKSSLSLPCIDHYFQLDREISEKVIEKKAKMTKKQALKKSRTKKATHILNCFFIVVFFSFSTIFCCFVLGKKGRA